mgnify:CR=1 FL=1
MFAQSRRAALCYTVPVPVSCQRAAAINGARGAHARPITQVCISVGAGWWGAAQQQCAIVQCPADGENHVATASTVSCR